LQAEAAGDTGASFLLLSAGDRAEHDSPAKWVRDHASLPTIRAYRLGAVDTANDKTTVAVSLDLQPVLDFVSGDVPAHADGEFVAVPEGDAWYVSLADSTTTAAWPTDQGATDATTTWVAARQRCETANEFESLVGSPVLADQLCHSTDTVSVDTPQRLQSSDSSAVVAAFGDQSTVWARVVTVGGGHPLRAVLAPLGDSWIVIGVLAPSP
jgi:hypothetical protein